MVTANGHEKATEVKKEYFIDEVVPNNNFYSKVIKRLFDIVFSVPVGIVLLPIMLVIAILIRIDSPGKAIFKQKRLGKNGKEFYIYKFRTMHLDAEKEGPQWSNTDDPRRTPLGATLRKYRLDELPQIFNILAGDMSLVGPRPERPYFYNEFEKYIHGFSNRLAVTPGLTGLAQVNGGYDLLPEEKIIYDMKYIETRSFMVDFKVILKTIQVVLTGSGAK